MDYFSGGEGGGVQGDPSLAPAHTRLMFLPSDAHGSAVVFVLSSRWAMTFYQANGKG